MATLYVTEYADIGKLGFGPIQIPKNPKLATNNVAIIGSTTQSAAFNAGTGIIRVHTDAICSVEIGGTNPVATNGATGSARMAANQTEYHAVNPGDKLAVISNT